MEAVDLRSDTVTRPSEAMRRAAYEAEVGDDVFGEDPTVRWLEERACELLGKQAAVFVASGTMGNQAALNAHTRPGQEIICDDRSHVMLFEMGMLAQFSGLLARPVPTADGVLDWAAIEERLRRPSDHFRGTGVVALENTHNQAGGAVYPVERIEEICEGAHAAGVKVHMDGARVFNAAAALGRPVREIVATVDSVTFCLSKGLGAPVGSVLLGDAEFIERARLARKALGGGMRQAGVIAAAGLVALENSPAKLAATHADARFLAEALAAIDGVEPERREPPTNIVFFRSTRPDVSAAELRRRLKAKGVLVSGLGERIRMLTHVDVDRAGCERAVEAVRECLGGESAIPAPAATPVGPQALISS